MAIVENDTMQCEAQKQKLGGKGIKSLKRYLQDSAYLQQPKIEVPLLHPRPLKKRKRKKKTRRATYRKKFKDRELHHMATLSFGVSCTWYTKSGNILGEYHH